MKKHMLFAGITMGAALLSGCAEEELLIYGERKLTVYDVEERIADELEVTNPDLDIEVSISTSADE